MPVVVHDGVQRNVDGGNILLFPHPVQSGNVRPTTFEASFDESINAGTGIYVSVDDQDRRGIARTHKIWYQVAGKIYGSAG